MTEAVLHDAAWFAARIGRSLDWVRRHMHELEHHRDGRAVLFCDDCVDAYRARTRVVPLDAMRRTSLSQARSRGRR